MPKPGTPALWARLALLLVSTFLALVVGEILVRTVFRQSLPPYPERALWRYDELLGWAHPPHQRTRIRHPEYHIEVATNGQGLRDCEYPFARVAGKKRLLVLGDSFAWGLGVEQPEVFVELLEAGHPQWEMINAGVSGYGTDQQYLYYRERGWRYRPDAVLLLIHANDLRNNAASHQQGRNKPRFRPTEGSLVVDSERVPMPSLGQRLERLVLRHSRLLGTVYLRSRQELVRRFASAPATDFALTMRLIEALADEAASHGARLLVVSVPMSDELEQRFERELGGRAIPYLALDEAFDSALAEQVESWRLRRPSAADGAAAEGTSRPVNPFVFETDFHWNVLGHRVAAEAVEKFLGEQGLL